MLRPLRSLHTRADTRTHTHIAYTQVPTWLNLRMFNVLSHLVFLWTGNVHRSSAVQSSANAQPSSKLQCMLSVSAIKFSQNAKMAVVEIYVRICLKWHASSLAGQKWKRKCGINYKKKSRAVTRKSRDAVLVLFGLKFPQKHSLITTKFKSSQASKVRLQSSKHTAQNRT